MTALPVVETTQGEIATYIPTNLISITDGQIYFDTRLFAAGVSLAIDVTKSVSRIGGKGQHPRIKEQAGRMKLDYLQFLELEVFTRFGTKLESSMEAKITRGRVLREILKQDRLSPLPIEFQLAWLTGFNHGYFDNVPPERIALLLHHLALHLPTSQLTLDQQDESWVERVHDWLQEHPHS